MTKAIVLMSGGLDSTTVATYAKKVGDEILGLSFNYGQRHLIEMRSSENVCQNLGIKRKIIEFDMRQIGASSLTSNIDVAEGNMDRKEIPNTYVPGRNIIFLSVAGAIAETIGAEKLYLGVNSVDYSGYPDCRPDFIKSMENTLKLGLAGENSSKLKLVAPLQKLSKCEIVKMGTEYGAPYHLTYSCYRGRTKSCGHCDSCLLRLRGFMEAGIEDPIPYEAYPEFYREFLRDRGKKI